MTKFTSAKFVKAMFAKVGVAGLIAAVLASTVLAQAAFAYSPYDPSAEAIAKTVNEVLTENGGNASIKIDQIRKGTLTAEQTRFSDDWRRYMKESYAGTPFGVANKDVWAKISPTVKFTFYKAEANPGVRGFYSGDTIALSMDIMQKFSKKSALVAHEFGHSMTIRPRYSAMREGMAGQLTILYSGATFSDSRAHYAYSFYKGEWLRTNVFRSDDAYYKIIANVVGEKNRPKNFEAYLDYYFENMGMPISANGFLAADARVFDNLKADANYKTDLAILSGIDSTKKLTAEQAAQLTAYYASVLGADYQTKYPKETAYTTFRAGSVVGGVTAKRGTDTIDVSWDPVISARYAVYYAYVDNATGAAGSWNVAGAGSSSLSIGDLAKGVTYYITVLPYTDAPSRVYGGFSGYVRVVT